MLTSHILVVLFLCSMISSDNCPEGCQCSYIFEEYQQIYQLTIFCNADIIESDTLLPENTTVLFLLCRQNILELSSLQPKMFQKLSHLASIIFEKCRFRYADRGMLTSFNYSKELYIYKAINFTLNPKMFYAFRYVSTLKITDTVCQGLSRDSLCILNNITNLALIRTGIETFSHFLNLCSKNQSFFSQLKILVLDFNKIQILRAGFAKSFLNILYLSFTGNRIKEIQNGSLVNLPTLKYLDISKNYLQTFPGDFLVGCQEIYYLKISNNPIKKIPSFISKLYKLRRFIVENTLLKDISSLTKARLMDLSVRNSSLNSIPLHL